MEEDSFMKLLGSSDGRQKQTAFHGGSHYLDRINHLFGLLTLSKTINLEGEKEEFPKTNRIYAYKYLRRLFTEFASKMDDKLVNKKTEELNELKKIMSKDEYELAFEKIEITLRQFADKKGLIMAEKSSDGAMNEE